MNSKYRVKILLLLSLICFYWAFLMQAPPPGSDGVPMFGYVPLHEPGYIKVSTFKEKWFRYDNVSGSVCRFWQASGLLICTYLILYLTFSLYSEKIAVIITGAIFAIAFFIVLGMNSSVKNYIEQKKNMKDKVKRHGLWEHALPAFILLGSSLYISYSTLPKD